MTSLPGLDPASPLYEYLGGEDSRLDSGDAEFVDVIHTAGGAAGYYTALGHVDFYPNGGTPIQPACEEISINISEFCLLNFIRFVKTKSEYKV